MIFANSANSQYVASQFNVWSGNAHNKYSLWNKCVKNETTKKTIGRTYSFCFAIN